jgi:hypothetical protein
MNSIAHPGRTPESTAFIPGVYKPLILANAQTACTTVLFQLHSDTKDARSPTRVPRHQRIQPSSSELERETKERPFHRRVEQEAVVVIVDA